MGTPHMAVPAIKKRRFFIYFKTIPNKYPIDKVRTIDSIVNTSPFCPAFQLSTFTTKALVLQLKFG
jgi:hypothetical protein